MGEVLIDFTPSGISPAGNILFERNPGGGPANVAVAVSMLGAPAAFMGKVGEDIFGRFLRQTLLEKKVDLSGLISTDEVNTTLAFVQLDSKGNRSFSFYRNPGADMMFSKGEINFGLLDESDIIHVSSVSMTDEPSRSATAAVAKYAHEKNKIVSFDPNLRELLWKDLDDAKTQIRSMFKYTHILKVSGEESEFLTGATDVETAAEKLFNEGIPLVFITMGPKGCYYKHKSGSCRMKTYDTKVVDTTGSGDAFVGAVLYKIAKLNKNPGELNEGEIREIVDFANAAGSFTASAKGAIPSLPTVEQVEECRKKTPILKEEA
jgi:fructokinase